MEDAEFIKKLQEFLTKKDGFAQFAKITYSEVLYMGDYCYLDRKRAVELALKIIDLDAEE